MTLTDSRTVASPSEAARTAKRGTALALLVGSHFLLNLDSAIVEVALPSIKKEMGLALADLSWVANAYILAFGGFLLLGGRLGDLFGRRRVFTCGLLVFAAASLLGGVAWSPEMVVTARAAQGLAAAAIAPTALSLLIAIYPDRTARERTERNKALATLGAVAATGGSAGYFLGGVLTDAFGWEATFLVNVPVAAGAALLARRLLPEGRGTSGGRFDLVSALMAAGGMTLMVYALVDANSVGWLSARTLGMGALAVLLVLAFLVRQRGSADPLLPLRIFRHRALCGANVVAALINMAIGPVIFFLSLYTQHVLDYSALAAGLAILPIILCVTVSSTMAGRLLRRFSQRAVMASGLLLFASGLVWMSRISGGAYWAELLGPACLVGLGGGLVFVTFTVSGTSGMDERDAGAASGVLTTSQKIGAAFGLAVLTALAGRQTQAVAEGGGAVAHSLTSGYQTAILVAVVPVLLALVATLRWIPGRRDAGSVQPARH